MTFNRGGRPPFPFDQEIADYICERLATSPHSLAKICSEEGMPSVSTVFNWLNSTPSFVEIYARAREAQGHYLGDETLDIADETKEDWIKRKNYEGNAEDWEVNGEAIARAKLRIDTRKWMAAHLAPKKYGDKLGLDQTLTVSTELGSLLERIAQNGKRLGKPDDDGNSD